jgi:hypothetical protein
MKTFLLTTCILGALMMASAAPLRAGDPLSARDDKLRLADACETNCRTNANSCRAQCADPEEQEQCIVNCGKSECTANCNKFERNCTQHCPSSKG